MTTARLRETDNPMIPARPETAAEIMGRLSAAIGLDPRTLGEGTVMHGVRNRMRETAVDSAGEYLDRLQESAEEMERLIEEVVVPETWFFRDGEPFLYLKNAMTRRLSGVSRPRARVLSIPCSTGEEPYSIAIALVEAGLGPEEIQIDAVDISRRALAVAATAWYGPGSFREEGPAPREKYFHTQPRGWRLDERITRLVTFLPGNLLDPSLLANRAPYSFVFCRNALIYLTPAAKAAVLDNLGRLLAPEGILFVGHAEQVFFCQNGYQPVPHPRAFACTPRPSSPAPAHRPAPATQRPAAAPGGRPAKPSRRSPAVGQPGAAGEFPAGTAPGPAPAAIQPPREPEDTLAEIRAAADRGDLEQAAARCASYLAMHPLEPDALCLRGLIDLAYGRLAPAEESFLKAMYLDPAHYEAMIHLSLLYGQMGDQPRAEQFRRRAARCAGRK